MLQGAVKRIRKILHAGHRLDHINHGVFCHQVDAQRDLVAGQHFLPRNIQRMLARVDELHIDRAADVPERVRARIEKAHKGAVDVEQARLTVLDAEALDTVRDAEALRELGRHIERDRSVNQLCLPRPRVGPEQLARVRLLHRMELAIAVDHANLVRRGAHIGEVLGHKIRTACDQRLLIRTGERRVDELKGLDLDGGEQRRDRVAARAQDRIELAIDKHKRALAFRHGDAGSGKNLLCLSHRHGPFKCTSAHGMGRVCPVLWVKG